jgi:tagatose 6-phosphate kinase
VIVTVTLNPSLLVRYEADGVRLGAANQVGRVRYAAGGRGLAVARLLHMFGHEVVAAGLVGGSAGERIATDLASAGVATQFTWIGADSRRVTRIRDAQTSLATSFAEPSPFITTEELGRLAADYRGLLDGATAVVLTGGLPDGLPAEIYGSLASYAAEAGVPVLLNAAGVELRHGVARQPALVIPEPDGDVRTMRAAGRTAVVLAAGSGVRTLTPGGEWRAELPPESAATGPAALDALVAGPAALDALVAGFVPGIALAWSWPDTLRHAVALAASTSPAGEPDLAAYECLLPQVAVTGPQGPA